jgi:pimeloyl-ACP methyl ester carboxylesterase
MAPAAYAPDRKVDERLTQTPAEDSFARRLLGSDFLLWAGIKLAPDQMMRYILATDPALVEAAGPETRDRVKRVLDEILPISARIDGLLVDGAAASDPSPVALDRIECPVLAISAEDDLYATAAPARYVAANVKRGEALVYETGGHMLVGHPEVMPTITAFVEQASQGQD